MQNSAKIDFSVKIHQKPQKSEIAQNLPIFAHFLADFQLLLKNIFFMLFLFSLGRKHQMLPNIAS